MFSGCLINPPEASQQGGIWERMIRSEDFGCPVKGTAGKRNIVNPAL